MIKVTDILSKPIISLLDGKTEGIIKNAVFDKNFKRVKYFVLFDNEELMEEKAVKLLDIYHNGENAIVVKDSSCLNLEISLKQVCDKPLCINHPVYTNCGKLLGKVKDIILDEKYFVQTLILENQEIKANEIISSGQNIVIVQDEANKINVKSLKRKNNKNLVTKNTNYNNHKVVILKATQNVDQNQENNINNENTNIVLSKESQEVEKESEIDSIMPKNNDNLNENFKPLNEKSTETPSVPKTMLANFEFLIGRKLEKNIYSPSKELIGKKNAKITTDTINKAKIYFKLRELTKYSRW